MSGWSGPRTRSWSASSGSATWMARAALSPRSFRNQTVHPRSCHDGLGQVAARLARAQSRVLVHGQDLLDQVPAGRAVLPRLLQRPGPGLQRRGGGLAGGGQVALAGQPFPDHPHHQPVRGHRGAVHAEGQQRGPGQPPHRLIHHLGGDPACCFVLLAERPGLPGSMQHRPRHPGRRQHRDQVHHRAAHPGTVPGPDRVQRQQHRRRQPMRIPARAHRQQQLLHRLGPQPRQVRGVVQVLGGDHRRGLRQRQRQPTQLARQPPGPGGVRPSRSARPGTPAPPPR